MRPHEIQAVKDHIERHQGWYALWLIWAILGGGECIAGFAGRPVLGAIVGFAPGLVWLLLFSLHRIVLFVRTLPERQAERRAAKHEEFAKLERELLGPQ